MASGKRWVQCEDGSLLDPAHFVMIRPAMVNENEWVVEVLLTLALGDGKPSSAVISRHETRKKAEREADRLARVTGGVIDEW